MFLSLPIRQATRNKFSFYIEGGFSFWSHKTRYEYFTLRSQEPVGMWYLLYIYT